MADLKRNMIELVTDVKEGEIITQTYWTSPFLPMKVVLEANDIAAQIDKLETDDIEQQKETFDQLSSFVADVLYNKQFTKQELQDGLHAPQALNALYDQIIFITRGKQSDETKKFLEKKS
ncbi:phage tail assembly chaperone G [Halobacillus sp. BBL2006]|uniref:phage tail assembly chaperone G n=1 Tax=Halobacillus sp. BBL2006 TaxID=1543706 RepID=UPI00054374D5|nr:hypothetical protein [Halobacillus sp. BBL2006]KHE73152.1 hypothetical protein LD39_00750 [Halobacillus sp. BBL2006]